jgi:hypothetical protein
MSSAFPPPPQKRPLRPTPVQPAAKPRLATPSPAGAGLSPKAGVRPQPAARPVPPSQAATAARIAAAARLAQGVVPPSAAQRPPADPVLTGLLNTIVGLEAVVEEETEALRSRGSVDLDGFSNRKSQGLMELNRSMQHIESLKHQKVLTVRLNSLRDKLAVNQAALKLHLEAVREISGIIAHAIREQDSDGTYSQSIRRSEAAYGYD